MPATTTDGWLQHSHTVWPSISAGPMSLVARLGDWTWQAVSQAFDLDVLSARTATGAPAYLSFHYCRYRGSPRFQLGSATFGDQLDVATQVACAGPQSTLTLHRVSRDGPLAPLSPSGFWGPNPDGELRAEQLNRWITPGGDSNTELTATAPVGFDPDRVPALPAEHSPRQRIRRARESATFRPAAAAPAGEPCILRYTIDAARDLNAVGLLYFAAYSGLTDWALCQAWRHWGRGDAAFLHRVVLDQELLYLSNADPGDLLEISVRPWRLLELELVDVVITRIGVGQERALVSVSTVTSRAQGT